MQKCKTNSVTFKAMFVSQKIWGKIQKKENEEEK